MPSTCLEVLIVFYKSSPCSLDLCSLHDNVDRLAVSVIWTLSSNLETVKSVWYGRTVIRNVQGKVTPIIIKDSTVPGEIFSLSSCSNDI